MGGDSCSNVVSLKPGTMNWMDILSQFISCKNCIVCVDGTKKNEKEASVGPFFKKEKNFLN